MQELMKKIVYAIAALALIFTSCAKELENTTRDNFSKVRLHVKVADQLTKVSADNDGRYHWQAGDEITVFNDSDEPFTFSTEQGGSDVDFGATSWSGDLGKYAMYPSGGHDVDVDEIVFKLSTSIDWAENATNMPMLGKITSEVATFKAVGGVLKLVCNNIPSGAAALLFSATNKQIVGDFTIADGKVDSPVISTKAKAGSNNELLIDFTGHYSANMVFYIPLPTGTIDGFTVSVLDSSSDEMFSKSTDASFTVARNKLIVAPELNIPASNFEKVTSAPGSWDGTYIIVSTDGSHVATGTVDNYILSASVTPDLDGSITCLDEYAVEIAEVSSGKYSIANNAGKYISWYGDGVKIKTADSADNNNALFSLSISGGHAIINNLGAPTRYIRWNGSVDFRMYTAANGNDVDLYQKIDPRVLTSITLSGTHPTAFYTGDAFSSEGLVVTAHYDNGTERVVSPTSITGYDMGTTGAQTVTVSYTEKAVTKTATYDITVSARPVYTVTYSDGGSDTEASGGAGVTLPVRSDSGDWKFQGWSESEVASETTTAPTVLTGTYHPDANITLYPVYKKTVEEPGTPTWNNTTSLVAGKTYVFGAVKAAASKTLADNTTFGAVAFAQDYNSSSDTWADYVDITPSSSGVVSNASVTAACKWELTSISEGNYIFKKGEKYLYLADTAGSTSGAQCGLNTSGACYLENVNATCKNSFLLHPTSESTKIMLYNTSSKGYRMYAPRSYSANMTPYVRFYVETIPVTENDYYISNPT